jgi:hypothetical protein
MKRVEFKKEPRNDEARGYQLGTSKWLLLHLRLGLTSGRQL